MEKHPGAINQSPKDKYSIFFSYVESRLFFKKYINVEGGPFGRKDREVGGRQRGQKEIRSQYIVCIDKMSWQGPLFSTIFAINFFKEFSTKEVLAMKLVLGTVLASLDKFSTTELICQTALFYGWKIYCPLHAFNRESLSSSD